MVVNLSNIASIVGSFVGFCVIIGIFYLGFKQNSKQHKGGKDSTKK